MLDEVISVQDGIVGAQDDMRDKLMIAFGTAGGDDGARDCWITQQVRLDFAEFDA
nr:hypothetical protein [Fodinicola feengrottensis]